MKSIKIYNIISLYLCILIVTQTISGCKDFLDVVPDDIPTIEHAFSNQYEAEKFLATCYSYMLPRKGADLAVANIMFTGGDEMWTYNGDNYKLESPWKIALGEQNRVSPFVNTWDGLNHAPPLFRALRDCNIFIENVQDLTKVIDLDPNMRERWIGEVKFLKAYYHFLLLRMYGPIPIIKSNLPISASPEDVQVLRRPVDEVVEFISDLIDEAAEILPPYIENQSIEAGRVNRTAALMLKARMKVMVASPLFNGNLDYSNFKNANGEALISSVYSSDKWESAVIAIEEALESAEIGGFSLYEFTNFQVKISDSTRYQMNNRGSITEKWNSELIWGLPISTETATNSLQNGAMIGQIDHRMTVTPQWCAYFSVPLRIAEMFYSDKGVPIDEDITFNYAGRYGLKAATAEDRFNIMEGWTTARLHFNRENRFYGSIAFDGAKWFMQNAPGGTDEQTQLYVNNKFGQRGGMIRDQFYNVTGYAPKKLVNWKYTQNNSGGYATEAYPIPEMRLADLYLLYAEALNEINRGAEAIVYLDKIRSRVGLEGVVSSWTTYSNRPNKPQTQDGLREIIRQERGIELAFEGSRLWDLRRWKTAEYLQNLPVQGWNTYGTSANDYYRIRTLHNMEFVAPRDYLWPIREYNITVNQNLVQNPGW